MLAPLHAYCKPGLSIGKTLSLAVIALYCVASAATIACSSHGLSSSSFVTPVDHNSISTTIFVGTLKPLRVTLSELLLLHHRSSNSCCPSRALTVRRLKLSAGNCGIPKCTKTYYLHHNPDSLIVQPSSCIAWSVASLPWIDCSLASNHCMPDEMGSCP